MFSRFHGQRFRSIGERAWQVRPAIRSIAVREIRSKYAGTRAGLLWALLQPVSTTVVFWLVFSVGLKATGPDGVPYIGYFVTGYLSWHVLQNIVGGSTDALRSNAYLIKKTRFSVEAVLITKLLVAVFEHVIFLSVALILLVMTGIRPPITAIFWLPYGALMLLLLASGLMLFAASTSVLHPDFGQSVGLILNVWFWLTPIVWVAGAIDQSFLIVLKVNPMVHIIEVYRHALGLTSTPSLSHAWVCWAACPLTVGLGAAVHLRFRSKVIDAL